MARSWYSDAAEEDRLLLDSIIISRLWQDQTFFSNFFFYSKSLSLTVGQTFPSAREPTYPLTVRVFGKTDHKLLSGPYFRSAPWNLVYACVTCAMRWRVRRLFLGLFRYGCPPFQKKICFVYKSDQSLHYT